MNKHWVLPVIVVSQFCCTSLWFAVNGVMDDIISSFGLDQNALGHLSSAVQLGFILGTLVFAFLTVSDRFSPSKVFFWSAIAGSLFNLATIWEHHTFISLMSFRGLTGFFLAGIYPVGMKIAADYFKQGLGKSLGYLVGALVIGTAFPHLLKDFVLDLEWHIVLKLTSGLAVFGGAIMVLTVPDGPYRKESQELDLMAFLKVFKDHNFRSAAFGYFGHMWELYAFWVFVPAMFLTFSTLHPQDQYNIPLNSFLVIGLGGPACIIGGYLAQKLGAKYVAGASLFLSGLCCLLSPWVFQQNDALIFKLFLIFWGLAVIADSPLFSSLVANHAPPESKGTALTIVNCIGFSITIVSIQTIAFFWNFMSHTMIYLLLAPGPILGLWGLLNRKGSPEKTTAAIS